MLPLPKNVLLGGRGMADEKLQDENFLLKIAKMSFVEGLNNSEIEERLTGKPVTKNHRIDHIQRYIDAAGRLLLKQQARLADIDAAVTVEKTLENNLCESFGLVAARVVASSKDDSAAEYKDLLQRYGRAAADYFDDVARDALGDREDLHVSVSGGQSILDMMSSLHDRERPNVHFYASALIGRGRMAASGHIGPEVNASVGWARSGRIPGNLYYGTTAPYHVELTGRKTFSARERHDLVKPIIVREAEQYARMPAISEVMEDMSSEINMAVASIGLVEASEKDAALGPDHIERLTMTTLLRPLGIHADYLAKDGVVGDFSYNLFDKDGQDRPEWKFFITAGDGTDHSGVEFYRNLVAKGKKVVVMAGARKEVALEAALNLKAGKLFNVLVTDAVTAQKLLKGPAI
jgi:DNA-binding transcriptional regulator LsrR (DeoR family)